MSCTRQAHAGYVIPIRQKNIRYCTTAPVFELFKKFGEFSEFIKQPAAGIP